MDKACGTEIRVDSANLGEKCFAGPHKIGRKLFFLRLDQRRDEYVEADGRDEVNQLIKLV